MDWFGAWGGHSVIGSQGGEQRGGRGWRKRFEISVQNRAEEGRVGEESKRGGRRRRRRGGRS